jgi:rod shape-determining protein MreC
MVVAFLIACVVLLVAGPRIQPVASVLSPVYVPVESAVSGVTDDMGATIGSLTRLPTLQRQNNSLRRQVAVLEQQLADEPLYRRENSKLTRELNFRDLNPHLDLQAARVIGQGATGLSSTVTIGAGSNDAVRLDNPVLDQNGYLIGKVTEVLRAQSTVSLLTAGDVEIPAMDSRTGARGLVETATGESPALDSVPVGQKVRRGDLIVTSGLWNEFPIGSFIGQIMSVEGGNAASFQSAPIRTGADLNNVEYVQVVRNFGPGVRVSYAFHSRGNGVP